MNIKKLILLLLLIFVWATASLGQQPSDKRVLHEREIRYLIRSQISYDCLDDMYVEISEQMVLIYQAEIQLSLKRRLSESEQQQLRHFWYREAKEIMPYATIENMLVPIVAKYLTYEEVAEINRFFNTLVGKKLTLFLNVMKREGKATKGELGRELNDPGWADKVTEKMIIQFPHLFPEK